MVRFLEFVKANLSLILWGCVSSFMIALLKMKRSSIWTLYMWMLQFLIGIHCCIDNYMYTGLAWIMFSKPADFFGCIQLGF